MRHVLFGASLLRLQLVLLQKLASGCEIIYSCNQAKLLSSYLNPRSGGKLAILPEPAEIPFVSASLDKLESVLVDPLNRGRNGLRKPGSEIAALDGTELECFSPMGTPMDAGR